MALHCSEVTSHWRLCERGVERVLLLRLSGERGRLVTNTGS
jgi:hypothetical protein